MHFGQFTPVEPQAAFAERRNLWKRTNVGTSTIKELFDTFAAGATTEKEHRDNFMFVKI
jgi:hypothetical protein